MNTAQINAFVQKLHAGVEQSKKHLQHAQSAKGFKIIVCGAFSTGKSSLLNELLGCDLPTGIQPITKNLTCIRYGKQKAVFLENKQTGEKQSITQDEATKIILNLQKKNDYRNYCVVYTVPSPWLEGDVEFIDTPGFEDDADEKLDEMTKQAIQEADFCIVTFACNTFGDMKEREFLKELQTLSNGNFVCVLNCLNRIHSQEQIDDLHDRAKVILHDCGNKLIGTGKYFMVDSERNSDGKYMDGFDTWLKALLKNKAVPIKKDAALSRGLAALSPVIDEGNHIFKELDQEYNQFILDEEKAAVSQCHHMALSSGPIPQKVRGIKTNFYSKLDQAFCPTLRQRLNKLSGSEYNDKAGNEIADLILDYSIQLENSMKQAFPSYSVPDPWDDIRGAKYTWTKRTTWTTRKGFFDIISDVIDFGDWDLDEYHTNNFVSETIQDTEQKTIPEIKRRANKYFDTVEKKLVSQQCMKLLSEKKSAATTYEYQANRLAEHLLEASLIQSNLYGMASE